MLKSKRDSLKSSAPKSTDKMAPVSNVTARIVGEVAKCGIKAAGIRIFDDSLK